MGLLDFFRPWGSDNAVKAVKAVMAIEKLDDPNVLDDIRKNDKNDAIVRATIARLSNPAFIPKAHIKMEYVSDKARVK